MRALFVILVLVLAAAPAVASTLSYSVEWEDNGVPLATGNASLTFSNPQAKVDDVSGQSDLDQLPVSQMAWVADLLLANAHHRWTSPDVTPPPQGLATVAGNFDLNFGAAGFLQATITLDPQNQVGTLKVETFNWVPGILYEPNQPFWAEIHEDLTGGGGGGQVDSDGCVIVNGHQVATLQGSVTLTPSQSLSSLPQSRVQTSILISTFGDDATFDGQVFVDEDEAWVLEFYVDEGQGYFLEGTGAVTMAANPDAQRIAISGTTDFSGSNYANLLGISDMTAFPVFQRVYYPEVPWTGTPPDLLSGAQVVDLGSLGQLTVEFYADRTWSQGVRLFQVGLDITQMQPISGPGPQYQVHTIESFSGAPNGVLDGTGSLYSSGFAIATWTGSYVLPGVDTQSQDETLVETDLDHTVLQQGFSKTFGGTGRADTATSASVATTLDLGGQLLTGAGMVSFVPLEIDDPNAPQTPNRFSVSGSVSFDAPLPSRALFLSELPALAAWLRQTASLPQTPPLGSGQLLGDVLLDFGTGYGTAVIDIDPDADTVDYDADLALLDLGELVPLPPKFWVQLESSTEDDEGEQAEVDHDCITICEEDPQTEEVTCITTCAVRARVRRETYPDKSEGDPFLELLGNLLVCVEFSPDNQTVTFTGEFRLEEAQNTTGAPSTASSVWFAPPFPNPSAGATTFSLRLPGARDVTLDLYDARGRRVRRVHAGELPGGAHVLGWDGQDGAGRSVASGVYWARLRAGSDLSVRRLLVVR